MTLIYLDATHNKTPVQFSFHADFWDILYQWDKIKKVFDKAYGSEYTLGETTFEKAKVREIKVNLISKDGLFRLGKS